MVGLLLLPPLLVLLEVFVLSMVEGEDVLVVAARRGVSTVVHSSTSNVLALSPLLLSLPREPE